MKNEYEKNIFFQTVLLILLSVTASTLSAQKSSEKVKSEITEALKIWNNACKTANLEQVMTIFDKSNDIMVVGSNQGEINKGKDEIKKWLSQLFGFAGFFWEMNRVDIGSNGKTAWYLLMGK